MNANLINAASKIVPNLPVLVNMMRLRVKQLCAGHRPLVVHPPGMGMADIALMEIIEGKLTYEHTLGEGEAAPAMVIPFPQPAKRAA